MHNNRRNTRFGMFIVAIIVSLLVFLTGCSSAQNETDTVAPVIEEAESRGATTDELRTLLGKGRAKKGCKS